MAKHIQTDFSKSEFRRHSLQLLNTALGVAQSPELRINIDRINKRRFFYKIHCKPKLTYIPFNTYFKKNVKIMPFSIASIR